MCENSTNLTAESSPYRTLREECHMGAYRIGGGGSRSLWGGVYKRAFNFELLCRIKSCDHMTVTGSVYWSFS